MNYTGLNFDGSLFYGKGCECKVIKQLKDWEDVYKAHQDFGYSFKKIQDNYFVRCCGKNSIWSEEEIKEMIQPNLKESIRKVLREESKGQKKLIGLIDEFGLNQAARMLGVSMTKLVQLSNSPINSVMAYQLLVDNISNGNLPIRYNEFNINDVGDGVIGWYCNIKTGHFLPEFIEQISVMATPFWDGQEYTPVEIEWFSLLDDKFNIIIEEEGGGDYYKELKHQTSFENVEELFNWYKEFYLPEVYNIVMNKLLPIVHSDIDDRLN